MRCPKGTADLVSRDVEHRGTTIRVEECPECGGVFLEAASLSRLRKAASVPHRGDDYRMSSASGRHACPACQSWLQEVVADDVSLDVCVECGGIWFDGGELLQLRDPDMGVPLSAVRRTPAGDPSAPRPSRRAKPRPTEAPTKSQPIRRPEAAAGRPGTAPTLADGQGGQPAEQAPAQPRRADGRWRDLLDFLAGFVPLSGRVPPSG